jgi:phenylpropionate dioxygenase-like ring-hydroxylating dioxygenase large terminal subunit
MKTSSATTTADRQALEHSLVRRLLDHIEHRSTDLADNVLEIPVAEYTSSEYLARELKTLFLGEPLLLCLSGAVPQPGSYMTLDVCGTPVLVARGSDGIVRAMANICRHRGVRIVDGSGEARRFTCPFHAWVYDLEGSLVGVPGAAGFEGMCREEKGLVQLPVTEGYGLVVGRLRPGPAIDIDEYVGRTLGAELAMLDFAEWNPYAPSHIHRVESNWKVALETFRENYHFGHLHRNTLAAYSYGSVLTFDAFGRHLRNCSAIRSIDTLRGLAEEAWGDVGQHFSYQYQLFPNTCMTFTGLNPEVRTLELWQILPVDEKSCDVVHTTYLPGGLSDDVKDKAMELQPWLCQNVIDGEDFWVAGRTEPGIRTGLVESIVIGRNEPALQHLHRNFREVVGEFR